MNDLADFLLARIADDEQAARTAAEEDWIQRLPVARWRYEETDPHNGTGRVWNGLGQGIVHGGGARGQAAHIARHDPARVLAECEAKRRIAEFHSDQHECASGGDRAWGYPYRGCDVLRLLALPYADHPDYRQEWTP